MEIHLTLEEQGKKSALTFAYSRMVNAGYVGRDQDEVRRHIEELAKKGIPGPESTPTLYPVIPRALVTDAAIEVYGHETSGEAEYVLLVESEREIYVGVGSDHTDRWLEETDIPRSKQVCPNVMSPVVWKLEEVEERWDQLLLRATVVRNGNTVPYQEGRLEALLGPRALLEFVRSKVKGPLDGTVVFSGTLGTLTGEFVYGERFVAELVDPAGGRRLEIGYDVHPLDYVTED